MKQYIAEMVGGSGVLRFFIQPTLAVILGIVHGVRDKHRGRPPFLADVIRARGDRRRRLGEGLREIAVPLCIAVLASYLFQFINRSSIHLALGFLYAVLFVAVPYLATRGIASRLTAQRPDAGVKA